MKFSNQKIFCSNCGQKLDAFVDRCPKCHKINKFNLNKPKKKGLVWMDSVRQLSLFLLGFLGFQLISGAVSLIFSVILGMVYQDPHLVESALTSQKILMLLNTCSYLFTFIGIFIIVYPYFMDLIRSFAKGSNYLIGLGYGVALILASLAYGLIISNIPGLKDIPSNDNQTILEQLIIKFPFASIVVFGLVGPMVEELTYRVGCFTFFNRFNRWFAYIVTILVFGFIHFNFLAGSKEGYIIELINIPSYIIAGAILCNAYENTSLAGSTTAHIVNNMYSIILTIIKQSLI